MPERTRTRRARNELGGLVAAKHREADCGTGSGRDGRAAPGSLVLPLGSCTGSARRDDRCAVGRAGVRTASPKPRSLPTHVLGTGARSIPVGGELRRASRRPEPAPATDLIDHAKLDPVGRARREAHASTGAVSSRRPARRTVKPPHARADRRRHRPARLLPGGPLRRRRTRSPLLRLRRPRLPRASPAGPGGARARRTGPGELQPALPAGPNERSGA